MALRSEIARLAALDATRIAGVDMVRIRISRQRHKIQEMTSRSMDIRVRSVPSVSAEHLASDEKPESSESTIARFLT
jgi:hypothetical protein